MIDLKLLSTKIFLVRVTLKIEIFIIDSVLKTNLELKDLNGEKIIMENIYEIKLLLSI